MSPTRRDVIALAAAIGMNYAGAAQAAPSRHPVRLAGHWIFTEYTDSVATRELTAAVDISIGTSDVMVRITRPGDDRPVESWPAAKSAEPEIVELFAGVVETMRRQSETERRV